jgi:hypothetical protein
VARHPIAGIVALALLTGCGGGEPPHAPPAASTSPTPATGAPPAPPVPARGRILTAADDGFVGRLAVGETALLRLPPPEGGPEPTASNESVILVRINNITETGYREWEIRAVRPGASHVSVPRNDRTPATVTLIVN